MYMKKYPCVYMRGGTSKAVFFHEKDLPEDKSLWDEIFLKVMGTPDVKQIDGMGGTGSRIDMYFEDPAGSKTGKLFPTGQKKEVFDVPGYGPAEVTVLDCSNPMVFIKASDLGIKGTGLTELNQNKDVMEHIERIRGMAAEKCGFVENWEDAWTKSTSAPKVSIVSAPQDYINMDGNEVKADTMDLCCRAISVGALHKAYLMTVAVGTGAASAILSVQQ